MFFDPEDRDSSLLLNSLTTQNTVPFMVISVKRSIPAERKSVVHFTVQSFRPGYVYSFVIFDFFLCLLNEKL
jgi:hypothetical protein